MRTAKVMVGILRGVGLFRQGCLLQNRKASLDGEELSSACLHVRILEFWWLGCISGFMGSGY